MARTKQQPNKYGIRQTDTGPARRPPSRGARADPQSQRLSQANGSLQHTRLRRRATAAAANTTTQEELSDEEAEMPGKRHTDTLIKASGSSLFPPLELEHEPLVEGLWGLMSEEERSGVVSADSPEQEAIEYVPGNLTEGIDEIENIEEVMEYELDQGEQPQKRRRVALSTSPEASRGKGAAAKGRRKSIANVVQTISDAMAKAQPSSSRSAHGVQMPQEKEIDPEELVEDQMEEEAVGGEADAEGEEGIEAAEYQPNSETQQGDVIAVADPEEEEAAARAAPIRAPEEQSERRLLFHDGQVPEAPGPDPNDTDIEEEDGRQDQYEPTQTSQETRATNGTGSAYAVSDASEIGYVPPQTNLPPRKSAANPTTNIPPAARVAAQLSAQPLAKPATRFAAKSAVSSAGGPQGVKRKRGRPRKIVEPITTQPSVQPQENAQPERAAKKIPWKPKRRLPQTRNAVAQNEHPPPTQITASSLMPSVPRAHPRRQITKAVPEAGPEPESNDSDTAQDTGPAEPIKVVEFSTGTVTSIVALMCSYGWTGQSMWKATLRWRITDEGGMSALTKEADDLVWQLHILEQNYNFETPKLGGSSFFPSPNVAKTLREQTDHLTGAESARLKKTAEEAEQDVYALCSTLLGPYTTTADGGSRAANKDAATARRSRAVVANDLVSYVIPQAVNVLEAACCLGGGKPDEELDEVAFFVPLKAVRITQVVWHLINRATYWLVRLENALAHELGYRDDRDSTAMGLGITEGEAVDPWQASSALFLASNREKSNDRAQLKVLLNRLLDELCYARIKFERANHVLEPQQPLTDLTKRTTPALPALAVAETMEIDNWDIWDQLESPIDSSTWPPRIATAAATSTVPAQDKAAPAAPAPRAAPRQVAKRSHRFPSLDIDDINEESMADITIEPYFNAGGKGKNNRTTDASAAAASRARSIEIVLSSEWPTSAVPAAAVDDRGSSPELLVFAKKDNATVKNVIEVVKGVIEDAAADAADDAAADAVQDAVEIATGDAAQEGEDVAEDAVEDAAEDFARDAVEVALEEDVENAAGKVIEAEEVQGEAEADAVVEQDVAKEKEPASVSAAENEKTAEPDKNPDGRSWIDDAGDDEGEPMMTRAIPRATDASSDIANSDAGSEESSIFVRPHPENQGQRVEAVLVASSPLPAPASSPALAPAPAPAPKPTSSKRVAAKPAEESQDDSFAPSQYTRAELKTILTILRTKGSALNLGQLAAELGRDILDVANRVESIKAAARTAALREKKPIQPWACAGFRLNN